MGDKMKFNKRLNIKVYPKILTNRELSDNEKLILSLDYTFDLKKGYTIYTSVDIGKLLSLHPNIVRLCRKSLIKKGYLVNDLDNKQIHRLTDKLKSIEYLIIDDEENKKYITECVLPFEIYNHSELTTGAKLLWGEYNTLSKLPDGYVKKRETTAKIMNVSVGSISNWTKQLLKQQFLSEYEIKSEYRKKQKVVRTIEFSREEENPIDEIGDIIEDGIRRMEQTKLNRVPKLTSKSTTSKKENDYIPQPLGPIKYSDLPTIKKGRKKYEDDYSDEEFNI
ncbi:hypothetical protein [Flavobacterium solisilvae]|uniref:MarR family transcriptional regulator n=1 Tax=Flavobacterium solisilvae TaxID=1852019 RepID=A0ABX1QSF2_9FLAO|nr:hypothetical protein [Flavobacterium solisilvae]NMH23955.1 hypothetical protein [Flavobacterium solisilvae]